MGFEHIMEIFDSILPILTNVTARLTAHFNGPQGTLQALALAGVVVIMLLFVVARRQGQSTQRSAAATSEPVLLNELVTKAEFNGEAAAAIPTPDAQADALAAVAAKKVSAPPEGAEKSGTNVDGFVFHRRKAKNTGTAAQIKDADPEVALAAIEQEMLATRQLYLDGVISKDVYVAETRNLYGKAQQKI